MARKLRFPKQEDSNQPTTRSANDSPAIWNGKTLHQLGTLTPERFERQKTDLSRAKKEIAILRDALTNRGADPEIIKRRAIVQKNPTLTAQGLCELFDSHKVPLTKSMAEAVSWTKAYKSPIYRGRIDSLICRDRKS